MISSNASSLATRMIFSRNNVVELFVFIFLPNLIVIIIVMAARLVGAGQFLAVGFDPLHLMDNLPQRAGNEEFYFIRTVWGLHKPGCVHVLGDNVTADKATAGRRPPTATARPGTGWSSRPDSPMLAAASQFGIFPVAKLLVTAGGWEYLPCYPVQRETT